ncbi:hypothetical protein Cni_G22083 [Canna indica]|uniref:RNase H type-1 domain-containing protein n=1 Tax=Canna indica TaxID=4628 RepID=A0AAQ3KUH3_9LILI|nr:hypothetical protein Cni_G22083 [Canna indica]
MRRMNVSQRVKMFNWKLLWGRLPTSEWFGKHSGYEVEKCYLCKEECLKAFMAVSWWIIWKCRNECKFEGKLRNNDIIFNKVYSEVFEYRKENKRKDTRERKGRELVENRKEIALLCDAAWSGSSKAGCGFVLKGEDDEVLAEGSGLEAANNPLYAEAKAIWFGLDNVRKRQIKRIQVWTDCKRLVNILKGEFQAPWNISVLINKKNGWRSRGLKMESC